MQEHRYRLKYIGSTSSWISCSDTSLGREKIFNFEIDSHGVPLNPTARNANNETDLEASECVEKAAEKSPINPPWLPAGVPTFWDMIVGNPGSGLWLKSGPYRVFMDQIGLPYRNKIELM
jgi:hypothetical protein